MRRGAKGREGGEVALREASPFFSMKSNAPMRCVTMACATKVGEDMFLFAKACDERSEASREGGCNVVFTALETSRRVAVNFSLLTESALKGVRSSTGGFSLSRRLETSKALRHVVTRISTSLLLIFLSTVWGVGVGE